MVAVINSGRSLHNIFNYNENKVKAGVAKFILASNYPMDTEELTLAHKLNRLLNQAKLNENVKRNSIHISLNFAVGENISENNLKAIASEYMETIGFGEQPFLVYQHNDASHPHIHIITTKIQADGSRIDTQNIGKNRSEPARKAIEKKYNLVEAEKQKKQENPLKPMDLIGEGATKLETKNAIAKVLNAVLDTYNYTSIPELNAVLKNYHIVADRGTEQSRVYQKNGLYYRLLDKQGNKICTPIKASLFQQNPGLKFLEKQFTQNEKFRNAYRTLLKSRIDDLLKSNTIQSIHELKERLEKENIQLICRINPDGIIYGLTYIDHQNKYVFNGSKLGKSYSAKAVQERFESMPLRQLSRSKEEVLSGGKIHLEPLVSSPDYFKNTFVEVLLQAENYYDPLPFQLKKTRRKKRRKKQNTRL
ncbi:relaxase/mobilization nuclease domain-containing protein [Pedobacter sp. SD-b]|uniref:Relaxase/mobilization nuclease domain-containing protein n=1 Tax=Pedobacter segetis TaxID=2793069 RepID=A0ABS1BL21_9SPHI|nr:relaxase/mobilization nuclease domain-containing protein [Pedobacter segetis]MBK0383590.1 relaxase/mobilization nuclease domain-containing protein [Pedobacter segetis]